MHLQSFFKIKFANYTAQQLHNFIRGNDKVPGAWASLNGEKHTFYASKLWKEVSTFHKGYYISRRYFNPSTHH